MGWKAKLGWLVGPEGALLGKMMEAGEKKEPAHPAPAPAPATTVVHAPAPAAPPSSSGSTAKSILTYDLSGMGRKLSPLALLGAVAATVFFLMGSLGLRPGPNVFFIVLGILGAALLAIVYRTAPELVGKVFTILGFAALGVGGFTLLALLQVKSAYIFTTLFLVFYIITLFAVVGLRALWVVAIIGTVIAVSSSMKPELYYEGSPIYKAVVGQQQSWNDLVKGTTTFINASQQGVARQIALATGDQSYEKGVEAQSSKPLGVYLDNFALANDKVVSGQPIDAFTTLRAESFKTDAPLEITLTCSAKKPDGTNAEGEIKPSNKFTVEEYDQQSVDCLLKSDQLIKGTDAQTSTQITMSANFDFTTSGFLKSYFMDQETIRSYRRQQLDPLDEFKISDKNPTAVYTGGPLKIGMGVGKQPISLMPTSDAGPTLSVTFEKNWADGKLIEMKELTLIAPPGLSMTSINLQPIESMCTGGSDKEQVCKISGSTLTNIFTKEELAKTFTTIRVQTKVSSIETLLGQAPISIRSFKVTVKYKYQIEKQTSVTITKEATK